MMTNSHSQTSRAGRDTDTAAVERVIPVARPTVWQLLTTGVASWWPDMNFEPVVGAPLVERWIVDRWDSPRELLGDHREGWAYHLDQLEAAVARAGTPDE